MSVRPRADGDRMSTEVINQLHALRSSIAESLRKDPRYLTISVLDRSIAEIADVLKESGSVNVPPPAADPLPAPHPTTGP